MNACCCAHCGATDPENTCAACQVVFYCGKACQVADWCAHKAACKAARKKNAAPAAASAPPPAAPFVLDLHCGSCGAELGGSVGEKCSACFRVAYCNRACQKAHWPAHKAACAEDKAALVKEAATLPGNRHEDVKEPAVALKALVEAARAKGALDKGAEDAMKRAIAVARREAGEGVRSVELENHSFTYAVCLINVGRGAEARRVIRESLVDDSVTDAQRSLDTEIIYDMFSWMIFKKK